MYQFPVVRMCQVRSTIVVFLCLWTLTLASSLVTSGDPQCAATTSCGTRPSNINVTLTLRNNLVTPHRYDSITVTGNCQYLVGFLDQAANLDQNFCYEAKYYRIMGLYITRLDGTPNVPSLSNWYIYSATQRKLLPCGISTYIPNANEEILFNYQLLGETPYYSTNSSGN